MEIKEYPHDFYAGKFCLILVMRGTHKEPETLEDYFEALNTKAYLIGTLGYLLSAVDTRNFHLTDPVNLDCHFENIAFLLMSLARELPDDNAESFMKRFGLTKAEVKNA